MYSVNSLRPLFNQALCLKGLSLYWLCWELWWRSSSSLSPLKSVIYQLKHNPSLHTGFSLILTEQDLPSTVFVSNTQRRKLNGSQDFGCIFGTGIKELDLIFIEKLIYSGINEMQISTKLQNATNWNNFPYWDDILNRTSQFTKTWENQMLALIIALFNSLSSNFQVMSKPILKRFDP